MTRHVTGSSELDRSKRSVAGHDSPLITNVTRGRILTKASVGIVGRHDLPELLGVRLVHSVMTMIRSASAPRRHRIDDERAGQLAEGHRRADRRRPVVVGAGAAARESHFARFDRRHFQGRAGRAVARAETVHDQRRRQIVANRRHDLCAFIDANQRSRDGERLSDFSEGFDLQGRAGRDLRAASGRRRRGAPR